MPIHANVTLHRILATLVMTCAQHIHTVRQKKQELTRNDRVRILLIKNFVLDKTAQLIPHLNSLKRGLQFNDNYLYILPTMALHAEARCICFS